MAAKREVGVRGRVFNVCECVCGLEIANAKGGTDYGRQSRQKFASILCVNCDT